ncbi:organic hydroperoxide resistance protein [Paraburkholderia rhizosphaerae]|jgi:Ohr subfamily peroxiredoxin|uniref:Ohr subfamily peroxiredoxin n=1 Tax=Paraburkholderia rhizosphaerae TaxID=480658 RepID=A0A4R8M4I5_9BURK|nr:organic hydroperoxide resistance protein [Paraburkholderia rhizosphaerae]TDY54752.1 Ohr subfamily peroxiredoxin [Paraburkholderia rhizosphaerae]
MNVLYRAQATSTGGREGRAISSDHVLDLQLTMPKELGGSGATGTNPEQLFAAGYSACFLNAMRFVAGRKKIAMPADATVTAKVGLVANTQGGLARFALDVELEVMLPGVTKDVAEQLIHDAHSACPYSNATRGNVDVKTTVIQAQT